ncbi:replication-relaxation family protein [Streptomyces pseudovenezuelae]|uniref:replication-relaxation family protein n=1 Tax=Streptomyces pseudovenezuelae TaxID=67350 RepID=UPI0036E1D571
MNISARYSNLVKPHLTDRDLAIIAEVGRFKVMRGRQIERLYFAHVKETSRARDRQAVLKRLKDNKYLAYVGERQKAGAKRGSTPYLYTLDKKGQELAKTSGRTRPPFSGYKPTLDHLLAIVDVYVDLVEADRAGRFTLTCYESEPYCWRDYNGQKLKPDAFSQITLTHPSGRRLQGSFFIEVDRANEHGAKIDNKLPQYLAYHEYYRAAFPDRPFPRIVFLAPDDRRVNYLQGLLDGYPDYRPLFTVGLLDDPLTALLGR